MTEPTTPDPDVPVVILTGDAEVVPAERGGEPVEAEQ